MYLLIERSRETREVWVGVYICECVYASVDSYAIIKFASQIWKETLIVETAWWRSTLNLYIYCKLQILDFAKLTLTSHSPKSFYNDFYVFFSGDICQFWIFFQCISQLGNNETNNKQNNWNTIIHCLEESEFQANEFPLNLQ